MIHLLKMMSCAWMLSACTARSPVAPQAAGALAPETNSDPEYVLLWSDALYYRQAGETPIGRAYDYGPDGRAAHPGEVYLVEFVQAQGAWLQVAMGVSVDWQQHCARNTPVSSPWRIALWVNVADAAPILTEPYAERFADGTAVDLRAGTPLVEGAPWVETFTLPVQVPQASRGIRYRPAPRATDAPEELKYAQLPEGTPVLLDGRTAPLQRPAWHYGDGILVRFYSEGDTRWIVDNSGCGTTRVRLDPSVQIPEDDGGYGGLGGRTMDPNVLKVATGTPLLWSDGSPAGALMDDLFQYGRTLEAGPLHCTEVPLGNETRSPGWQDTKVELCVDAARVQVHRLGSD